MKKDYSKLQKKIGIEFDHLQILDQAFVHKSYVNEHRGENIQHNERLEFLGDAVLELAATRHLFHGYPSQDEGQMTSFRSALVKGNHLAEVAKDLALGDYLYLSNGEEKSGGREKGYILANLLEALIGAVYLEHGYEVAEKFIEKFILKKLDEIIRQGLHIDSKSRFQEICQEREEVTPHYDVLEEGGPDHNKTFIMGAYIGKNLIARGSGSSKQKAEDQAAQNALKAKKW